MSNSNTPLETSEFSRVIASALKQGQENGNYSSPKDDSYNIPHFLEIALQDEGRNFQTDLQRGRHEQDMADRKTSRKMRKADRKADRKMRIDYAKHIFRYLCGYSSFAGLILLLQGFNAWFHISDTALSILIGSTAASAIGLVAIVLRGLFAPPK